MTAAPSAPRAAPAAPAGALGRRAALRWLAAGLGAAALGGCSAPRSAPPGPAAAPLVRVASLNVRVLDLTGRAPARGLGDWTRRRHAVLAALRRIAPDLVAFQEMESWTGRPQAGPALQLAWLAARMPGFGVAVAARADGRATGQPIFYRRARFALGGQGSVPLGDAPGRAGAFAGYADLVTWARLDDRATGRPVTVVNLHLHFSDRARRIAGAQTGLGLVAAARARGDRVVVLGDLNAGTRSCPVAVLRAGGLSPVPSRGASFHFGQGAGLFGAIDHVFHGPGFAAAGPAGILRDTFDGVWPSDHHPVWADLRPV